MDPAINYDDLKNLYAQAHLPPKATKVKRGEHLDIFPNRLPLHCAPPLRVSELLGLFPPMYILGWYYTMNDFAERFGRGGALNVFTARILAPFHEKYGDEMAGPLLDSMLTDNRCIVFIASNSFPAALDLPDKERVIEGVKAILQEDRDPEWIRIPVSH